MGTRFFRVGLVLVLFGVLGLMAPIAQAAPEAPPANDNFANAIVIYGSENSQLGTNLAATKEAGEPNHAGNAGGESIWYQWTAPSTGGFLFSTFATNFDTVLGVYTGASVSALTEVASNDDCWDTSTSCLVLYASEGVTYRIAIDGFNGASGPIQLGWAVSPPNDDFANAEIISGESGTVDGTTAWATREPGEPNHGGGLGGSSVWYQWTAPQTMRVRFYPSRISRPLFGIYTGNSVNALSKVTNGSICGAPEWEPSYCVFNAIGGTTYHIAIDQPANYYPDFSLDWGIPPGNDDFENAQVLTGATGTVNGSNVYATQQPGELTSNNNILRFSVWYAWTAPADNWIRFDTAGSDATTYIQVYTGSHLEEVEEPPHIDGCVPDPDPCLRFFATAGTKYLLVLENDQGNALTLNWRPLASPANDDFADAQVFNGNSAEVAGTTIEATSEAEEPDHNGYDGEASVWYEWTAPKDGRARLDAIADFGIAVAVYTGNSINALTEVQSSDEPFNFEMTQGTTYAIAVDGYSPDQVGPFTLKLNCPVTGKPKLSNPGNGSIVTGKKAILSWQETDCASHYEVMVHESSKMGPVISQNKNLDATQFTARKLKAGQTYYWQVKACSAFQCKASAWRSFTVKN